MQQRHTAGFFVLAFFLLSNCVSTPRHTLEEVSAQGAFMPQQGTPLAIEIMPRETIALHEVEKAAVVAARLTPERVIPLPLEQIDAETLWLARCIFSETKLPEEQELVAWVVRNRVETQYRGKTTYREIVLDPYQFSAFNTGGRDRDFYISLGPQSAWHGWQQALAIAKEVRQAEPLHRPFPQATRHFFSERSMRGWRHPVWARGLMPIEPNRLTEIDERRFRFYADVS